MLIILLQSSKPDIQFYYSLITMKYDIMINCFLQCFFSHYQILLNYTGYINSLNILTLSSYPNSITVMTVQYKVYSEAFIVK